MKALKYVLVVLWGAFVVTPLLWALTTSFKTANAVTGGPTYIPYLQYEPSLAAGARCSAGRADRHRQALSRQPRRHPQRHRHLAGARHACRLRPVALHLQGGFVKNADLVFFFISQRIMPPIVLSIPFFLLLQFLNLLDTRSG